MRTSTLNARADHYATLGVRFDATQAQIKHAFRAIALVCHPDRAGEDDASSIDVFKEASAAYEVLGNPELRARYDAALGGPWQNAARAASAADPSPEDESMGEEITHAYVAQMQAELNRIREELNANAARMREEAHASAARTREEAHESAARMRDQARASAARMRDQARAGAARMRDSNRGSSESAALNMRASAAPDSIARSSRTDMREAIDLDARASARRVLVRAGIVGTSLGTAIGGALVLLTSMAWWTAGFVGLMWFLSSAWIVVARQIARMGRDLGSR